MNSSTKDKAQGTYHKAKGTVKQAVGHHTHNPRVKNEGIGEKIAGKIQETFGQAKKVFGK